MDGPCPRPWVALALLLSLPLGAAQAAAAEPDGALVRTMLDDAELRAVTFVDADHGWAVGDRGVVWRTENGGQTWQLSPSGCGGPLRAVHFTDPSSGWAAGGEQRPYVAANKGVLLRTHDGGQTWEADKGLLLPAIRAVRFFGGPQGWALSEPSALFPSSLFYTDTGGQSWTPILDRAISDWTVADFADAQSAAVAGSRGLRAAIGERRLNPWQQSEYGLREPRALRMASPTDGWLAGDGGLLLLTRDGGRSWQSAPQDPTGSEQFDFRTVEVRSSHVWVAGSPGTRIMHSADSGATWESVPTEQNATINSLVFIDAEHGWAVGALGTILATNDGGRTWQKQQGLRARAAVLAIYSDADRVPLEVLARLAGNEGYVTAVELLARRDAEPDTTAADVLLERQRAALMAVGCSATEQAWGFPLRQRGVHLAIEQIVDGWNRMYAGQGVERLEEYLVQRIRAWRPEVIVTSAASPGGEDPLGHLVNQVVLRAVTDASDGQKFPEQLNEGGLTTWTVKKIAGSLPTGKLGTINVNTSQLAPRLTRSLADYAGTARGLLDDRYRAPPNAWGFRLYLDSIPQGLGQQDFFAGLTLQANSESRRELPPAGRSGVDAMRQIAERHRNLQAILTHAERSGLGSAALLGQIGDLTRGLDAETGGQALFELAHTYFGNGQWDFAAATFQLLTEKYPAHPLATPSLVWLVQYYASGEAVSRTLSRGETSLHNGTVARSEKRAMLIPSQIPPADPQAIPRVTQASAHGAATSASGEQASRSARAAEAGKALERLDSQAWSDMHVQFPLAAARGRATEKDTDRFLATVYKSRPRDSWWAAARGEQWLADGMVGTPPKTAAHAQQTAIKPRLDGELDDDVWQQAEHLDLASPLSDDSQWPGAVMLAYDDEYLYVAIDCHCAPQADYPMESRTRPRDADLSAHDRVELFLDIDRDCTTYYQLSVDHRGWTAEKCWGDASWNPRWFVAAVRGEENWTVEAAIPLAELTAERVGPKTAWALGLQRVVPGVGFQSWTRPATTAVTPQGFGYFIFD